LGSASNSYSSLDLSLTTFCVIHEFLTTLSTFLAIVVEAEILEVADLIQLVFNILDDSGRSVFDQIVHAVECFEDPAPVLGL